MKNRITAVAVALAAAVMIWAAFFRASEEDRIKKQMAALAAAVRIDPAEAGTVARPLRLRGAFGRIFTPRVRLAVPELRQGEQTRDDLFALAAGAGEAFHDLDVTWSAIRVTIDRDARPPRADAEAVATVNATESGAGPRREVRGVTMHFDELEGEWRISEIAVADAP